MQFFPTLSYKPRYHVEFSSRIWYIDEQTYEMLVMAAQEPDLVIELIDDVKLYGIWYIAFIKTKKNYMEFDIYT